ncbi:Mn2+ and Fe2+ transporters of the NRAMP family [Anaerosphaera aminiphila DSM 21120]|uniref:Mn2+ and Fe2+ transporters of the NRAMP family n=1 Tax=Anaerosphaera aminiphila DSM 21120 TaxID=1120995 RepID=A0A1M5QCV6_9FIRM|nr:NRAMP family divalent metal transporter [Anaerosphaera aminiphila]SHH11852.1 Mn2+ and Fe2+ transporters of the NRAMP family [Anaerosphaera aminiphila DSM 21120]
MGEKKKSNMSVLLGAAFLMATSAIGPGFMAQTANFTQELGADFAFVIVVTLIMSLVTQLNVWRVIGVSGLRGQDIANKVLPGLGYVIAFLVAAGGLAFNIGNVGGTGIGFNVVFGLDVRIGSVIGGLIGIGIFSSKSAGNAMDKMTQILGAAMIVLIGFVCVKTHPPVAEAALRAIAPKDIMATQSGILTLLGGTVGGYIVFSGGHRLIDAGITGKKSLSQVNQSAMMGIGVTAIVRVLLFLAVLGVITSGGVLDPDNMIASAFKIGAGTIGYKIFGLVMLAAAATSVVGAAYTSVSFLKTLFKPVERNENKVTIIFIVVSTIISILIGSPQTVLVVVGAVNGLILPITLCVMLIASKKTSIIGDYKHSNLLFVLGWIVVLISAYVGVTSFGASMSKLF